MIPILKLWEMTQIGQLMLRFVNYNVDQQTILTCPAMSPCHISGSSACVTRNGAHHCVFLQNNDVMDYFLTSSNLHPGSYERPSSPFAEDPPVWWNKNCNVNLRPALEACTNSWCFFWESTYSWWFGPLRYDAIKSEPLTLIATPECIGGFIAQFTMRFYLHV